MIILTRQNDGKKGTHGTFRLQGLEFHSLERRWEDNKPFESCVPPGEYVLIPHDSAKYGECFVMVNPELNVYYRKDSPGRPENGRYMCLFVHRGNEVENFVGCIGASHAYDVDNDRLLSSTTTACKEVNRLVDAEGSYRLLIQGALT